MGINTLELKAIMKEVADLKENLKRVKALLVKTKDHKVMLGDELAIMKTTKVEVETEVINLATKNQELQ